MFSNLIGVLLFWALLSMGTAVLGLYAKPREFWQAFWFMSGLWGWVDGVIAWLGVIREPLSNEELAPILLINAGLDVGYLVAGLVLLTRTRPLLKGFGLAIVLQGLDRKSVV